MGLKEDLKAAKYEALIISNPDTDVSGPDDWGPNHPATIESELQAKAIIDFLQKQTFTIRNMKATVKLEQIKTTDGIGSHVGVETLMGEWGPVFSLFEKLVGVLGLNSILNIAKLKKMMGAGIKASQPPGGGARTDPLNLTDIGNSSQGGTLIATGYAFIGDPANEVENLDTKGVDYTELDNNFTEVKLVKVTEG